MAAKATDTFGSLAGSALAGDDALRRKTQSVFGKALKHAQYTLDFGTESEKSALMKAIVPQMMRALQDEAADAAAAAQRAAYDRMRATMRGDIPEKVPVKRAPRKTPAKKAPAKRPAK
jgi:hypothetical protein